MQHSRKELGSTDIIHDFQLLGKLLGGIFVPVKPACKLHIYLHFHPKQQNCSTNFSVCGNGKWDVIMS